jgi:hypothetical protein
VECGPSACLGKRVPRTSGFFAAVLISKCRQMQTMRHSVVVACVSTCAREKKKRFANVRGRVSQCRANVRRRHSARNAEAEREREHPPGHGWMNCGQETLFHCLTVPELTIVVTYGINHPSIHIFYLTYLLTIVSLAASTL